MKIKLFINQMYLTKYIIYINVIMLNYSLFKKH